MRRVTIDFLCNLHPERKATVEGFRWYWPTDGGWREADLCDECALNLDIAKLNDMVRVLGTMRRHPDQSVPHVPGVTWVLCSIDNGTHGAEHATTNNRNSLCGHITDPGSFKGPATGQLIPCGGCVMALRERVDRQKSAAPEPQVEVPSAPESEPQVEVPSAPEPQAEVGPSAPSQASQIVAELRAKGWSEVSEIAERIGVSAHYVSNVLSHHEDAKRVKRGVYRFIGDGSDG